MRIYLSASNSIENFVDPINCDARYIETSPNTDFSTLSKINPIKMKDSGVCDYFIPKTQLTEIGEDIFSVSSQFLDKAYI